MPPGTPYNSFIVPYPIRVDEFSVPRDDSLTVAALHLLTHIHSDHVKGLNAKSFSSVVICSKDAKEMLLRHETYLARCLRENELVIERARTYSHLKTTSDISDITAHNEPHAYDLLVRGSLLICSSSAEFARGYSALYHWKPQPKLKFQTTNG